MNSTTEIIWTKPGSVEAKLCAIPRELAVLDWRGRGATKIAGEMIRGELATLSEKVEEQAQLNNLESSQLWCNLVANTPERLVTWFWLPIQEATWRGESLLGQQQETILKQMPVPGETIRALAKLACNEGPGKLSNLIQRCAPAQKAALFQARAAELEETHPPKSGQYLLNLILLAVDCFSNSDRVIPSVRRWLSTRDYYRGLSLTQLGQLPSHLQAEIAASADHQHTLLTSGAEREYGRMLESAHSHGLASIYPRQRDWRTAIKSGKLDDPAITQGLEYWQPPLKRLHPALAACSDPSPSDRLVSWIGQQPPSPELSALALLSSPRFLWSKALCAMDPEFRNRVIDLIDPSLLAHELFDAGLPERVLYWATSHHSLRRVLIKYMFRKIPARRSYGELSCGLSCSKFWQATSRLAGSGILSESELLKLKIRLEINVVNEADPRPLLELATVENLTHLLDGEEGAADIASLLINAVRCLWLRNDQFSGRYQELLSAFPESVLERHAVKMKKWEVDAMLSTNHAASLLDALYACPDRKNAVGWVHWLRNLERKETPLPSSVESYLVQHSDWLKELLETHPRLLCNLAVSHLPLKEILPYAFRSRATGRLVDKCHSQKDRLKLLNWVQNRRANRPRLAAACELGLLFGIRFTPFLYQLARSLPVAGSKHQDGHAFNHRYHSYPLPKKSGGNRIITAPDVHLKGLQRALLRECFEPMDRGSYAYGFRKDRSIVDNAHVHAGSDIVVNADIRGFFPNTPYKLIRQVCGQLAGGTLSPMAQWLVTEICSFEGGLPTGAPSSPAIGNLVLARLDQSIGAACSRYGIRYSRYADDLTFSGAGDVTRVLPFAARLLGELGYELDPRKTNIFRKGRRQLVTGLVVNEKPNMVRRLRRRLRAAVHRRVSGGTPIWHGRTMSDQELLGRIAFLNMTQPAEAGRLWWQLDEAGVLR